MEKKSQKGEDDLLKEIMLRMSHKKTVMGSESKIEIQDEQIDEQIDEPIEEYKTPSIEEIFSHTLEAEVRDLMYFNNNKKSNPNTAVEVEASFGVFGDSFEPGVKNHTDFTNVYNNLFNGMAGIGEQTTVEISTMGNENIRKIFSTDNPHIESYETKFRYPNDDKPPGMVIIPLIGVRISRSYETKVSKPKTWQPTIRRIRTRYTYTYGADNDYFGMKVDLSIVNTEKIKWTSTDTSKIESNFTTYEIEVEIVSPKVKPINFIKLIYEIYAMSISYGKFTVLSTYKDQSFMTIYEREYAVKRHNELFSDRMGNWRPRNPYTLYKGVGEGYWNKPVNILWKNLMPSVYAQKKVVCEGKICDIEDETTIITLPGGQSKMDAINIAEKRETKRKQDLLAKKETTKQGTISFPIASSVTTVKLNGSRFLLLVTDIKCWLIFPPYSVYSYGELLDKSYDGSLLDGEMVVNQNKDGSISRIFHIFDILFSNGEYVGTMKRDDRLAICRRIMPKIKPFLGKILNKYFYTEGSIYNRINNAMTEFHRITQNDESLADGIIIQPYGGYMNTSTYKWKPQSQMTIDFKFVKADNDDIGTYDVITSKNVNRAYKLKNGIKNSSELELFSPIFPVEYNGITIVDKNENRHFAGLIVECEWNFETNQFDPVRVRSDRTSPNSSTTAQLTWVDIHDPVYESTITGKDMFTMRKFHNNVKENLLNKYLNRGDTIIDIGTGRGGDIKKWGRLGLKKVYAIEPNTDDTINELKNRVNSYNRSNKGKKTDIEILNFGAEQTSQIKKHVKLDKISAIVSFFSLTFFGKSKENWSRLLETLSIIPDGGLFFGIVMDGKKVYDMLEEERIWQSKSPEHLEIEASRLKGKHSVEMAKKLITEAKTRRLNNYEVLDDDMTVFYGNETFSIEQESVLSDIKPFEGEGRNEIHIKINDTTSMVDYNEWLFMYNLFVKNMKDLDFVEVESYFLSGRDADFLPENAYKFSSLNRVFCFKRIKAKSIAPKFDNTIAIGKTAIFRNPDVDNMIMERVRGESDGILHATLRILEPEYTDMTVKEKDNLAMITRTNLANSLDMKKFKELNEGKLAKDILHLIGKKATKVGYEAALENFKNRLSNKKENVSIKSLLELLTNKYKTSIYLFTPSSKGMSLYYHGSNKMQCANILKYDKSIIIGTTDDDLKFFAAGVHIKPNAPKFIFNRKDDVIIQLLHDKLC